MLLSFHKFPSPWSAPAAKSGHFCCSRAKTGSAAKSCENFLFRCHFRPFHGKTRDFSCYRIPLKMVRLSERSKFRRFSAYLPWHADPVTKSGTHRSPPFLHCHLTTSKISSQRFRPICNTLVTNRRFCYSLT